MSEITFRIDPAVATEASQSSTVTEPAINDVDEADEADEANKVDDPS